MFFHWLSKLLFGPGKPVVACDQPPAAPSCSAPPLMDSAVLVIGASCCPGALHRLPALRCPNCEHELQNWFRPAGARPEAGSLMQCVRCGHVLKLIAGPADECGGEPAPLAIRSARPEELRALFRAMPESWYAVELRQRNWRDNQQARVTWARMGRRSWN